MPEDIDFQIIEILGIGWLLEEIGQMPEYQPDPEVQATLAEIEATKAEIAE